MLRVLPFVAEEECFALKGGTAINFFVRDMPRLSVDIDLMYLPVKSRADSLAEIDAALKRIQQKIQRGIPASGITPKVMEGAVTKLLIRADGVQVKIELSPVMRGTVYEPKWMGVSPAVEDAFQFAEIQVVSFEDLYAGKILAALDRQHPRDLFDVRDLLTNEGIGDALREAVIVYLLSHNKPMGEVLSGRRKDLAAEYQNGFIGMTDEPVSIESLIEAQNQLIEIVIGGMSDRHKQFLIGFEAGTPDWSLLHVEHASTLPAILWRQQNLATRTPEERAALVDNLKKSLGI
ncbi:MAG: nucleotidyl transferase AbiEii/AbiGii toxin family protein [Luteolibacter sp.]